MTDVSLPQREFFNALLILELLNISLYLIHGRILGFNVGITSASRRSHTQLFHPSRLPDKCCIYVSVGIEDWV